MLDGRRTSIEPMATRLGEVHYQVLHHFVAASPWDWRPVRRRLAERLCAALQPTAWAVDDTGFPKDGTCSVGVQRQYSGTLGKTANCQLGVSVNAVTEHASCPVDWRLFLPERWDAPAWPSGAWPATCPTGCSIGRNGSWCWTCSMSWPPEGCARRCCWPTAATPKSGGVGLTLWQLLGELQVLLACWAGACPLCKRPAPRWLRRTGRLPAQPEQSPLRLG
jgi:DDE superfamily endonuclease